MVVIYTCISKYNVNKILVRKIKVKIIEVTFGDCIDKKFSMNQISYDLFSVWILIE